MTRDELKVLLKKIQSAYPRYEIIKDSDTLDVWYECLGYMDYKLAQEAVIKAIQTCEFPPAVSNLCDIYGELKEIYDKKMRNIREYFEVGGGMYPGSSNYDDDEAFEVFKELTIGYANGDMDLALYYASKLSRKCIDDYKILEQQSMNNEELSRNFPNYYQRLLQIREAARKKNEQRS